MIFSASCCDVISLSLVFQHTRSPYLDGGLLWNKQMPKETIKSHKFGQCVFVIDFSWIGVTPHPREALKEGRVAKLIVCKRRFFTVTVEKRG